MNETLWIYGEQHAPHVVDPARIGYAIDALLPFWGELPLSAITKETCRRYGRVRERAPGTIRKELGTLQAAINYCVEEGYLINPPSVTLPDKPAPKDTWLTRDQAAQMLRVAWRNADTRHIAKFILVGLYSGTRKTAILRMRFMPNTIGGHVDTENGMMYRNGLNQVETKKRQPSIRITPRLLSHLRRWERDSSRWVIEFRGQGVGSIKTAWKSVVTEAGLAGKGVTPHTLRHTAITWAMQAGVDIYEAAGYFGVDIETMFKVYAHHHPDHQSNAVAAVGRGGRKL